MQDIIEEVFGKKGLLSQFHKGFEERPGQVAMAAQVLEAYEKNKIALIEAGTGIGKSLAYLVPAVFWALRNQEKTIISTYTIALQEQLIAKDIPFLLDLLEADVKAVLVKGISNYLCLKRLKEAESEPEIDKLRFWSEKTKEGSKSEISVSNSAWDKVSVDGAKCTHVHCSYYRPCFLFKARRKAEDAQILVVNHHLLFSDLAKEEKGVLPKAKRVIFDEAHHIEQIALESLSKRTGDISLIHLIDQYREASFPDLNPSLSSRIEIEIPSEKKLLIEEILKAFLPLQSTEEKKILLEPKIIEGWKPQFQGLIGSLHKFSSRLFCLRSDLEKLEVQKEFQSILQGLCQRLDEQIEILEKFFKEMPEIKSRVRWIETYKKGVGLVDADLDIASYLDKFLFSKYETSALCSATLTTAKDFGYLKDRLGLSDNISENIYESPFDYENRTLFLVPSDLPLPSEPTFNKEAAQAIISAVRASKGNAFILFTSYEMLKQCYEMTGATLEKEGYFLLKQGDKPRNQLLEIFKANEGSILFGTDSFWEGVDVAGEQLRLVVIAKLPFKAPDDPFMLAHSNYLTIQGKAPFFDYAVPLAVVKFKQGFGRLMRKKTDRGCVLCLDKRLITKAYGKLFLKSLPPAKTCFDTSAKIFDQMKTFYEKR